MRHLAVLLIGSCLFVFGCAGDSGTSGDGASSTSTESSTEVAEKCPGCGADMVAGKCPT